MNHKIRNAKSVLPSLNHLYALDLAGVYLPRLCEKQGGNARRGMAEIKNSGIVAPAPESGVKPVNFMITPAMAPAS